MEKVPDIRQNSIAAGLTTKEVDALDATVLLWEKIITMEDEAKLHPDNIRDLRFHIHAIQSIIGTRILMRGLIKPTE